jgi:hypothetical protein
LFVAVASRAHAWGEPVGMMLEPTYALPVPLFLRGGEDVVTSKSEAIPYTLDAGINLHVPLTSSLVELDSRDGWAHSFVFIPRIDLRHGRADSFPIRTPGYYPTVRFQVFQQRQMHNVRRRALYEFFFAHHSNGQSGCLYRDQVEPRGGRCRFAGPAQRKEPMNHIDGSFATNEVGLRTGLDLSWGPRASALRLTGLIGGVLFRPVVGGIDPEIEEVYGVGRAELWFRIGKRMGQGALASELGARVRSDVRLGGQSVRAPVSLIADGFWRLDHMRDWGPFVRLLVGSDPYNIRFSKDIVALGLGMMWEP